MKNETFDIGDSEYIELFKLLKAANLCEQGAVAKHEISDGYVQVDGKVETRKACKIRKGQKVVYNGFEILVK